MSAQSVSAPLLGMYVHQHWGYRRPYSARTWTLEDWHGYAAGLAALGYNAMMIWPVLEIIPDPLTPSDRAHLEKMRAVIDLLHREFDMRVFITMGPNVISNEEAAKYAYEERPYFCCDRRLNPADAGEMDELFRIRRTLVGEYFHDADGFVIIDSDPGGYIGSTNAEFVEILRRHMALFAEAAPNAYMYYWMWIGWETYNRFWEDALAGKTRYDWSNIAADCKASVRLLLDHPEERWRLFCCMNDVHKPLVKELGVQARTLYNPYGLVELEPAIPLTNFSPEKIRDGLAEYDRELTPLGVFANAQTHVTQLPNTYIFSQIAQGGTADTLDVPGFAAELMPGCGALLVDAWAAMGGEDTARMRTLAAQLDQAGPGDAAGGRFAGLLFGNPQQYLADLAMMLAFRADMLDFAAAYERGVGWREALRAVASSWKPWTQQTGFVDAYFGPVADSLHPALRKLDDPAITQALFENDDFCAPQRRHGVITRLIAAIEAYLEAG